MHATYAHVLLIIKVCISISLVLRLQLYICTYCKWQNVKKEMVHWILSKCRENFCSFHFNCMESVKESHCSTKNSLGKLSWLIKNPRKPQNFSLAQLFLSGKPLVSLYFICTN